MRGIIKFYSVLLLLAPLAIPSAKAMQTEISEYEREGRAFPRERALFIEEKSNSGRITHRPKEIGHAATIEYRNDSVIVAFKRFEIYPLTHDYSFTEREISFHFVPPNAKKNDHSFNLSDAYASLSIRFWPLSEEIILSVFAANTESKERPDYAKTIASGIKLILLECIPSMRKDGYLSNLKTIFIEDDNEDTQKECLFPNFTNALKAHYRREHHTLLDQNLAGLWSMQFSVHPNKCE